jgi:hypothetical protein
LDIRDREWKFEEYTFPFTGKADSWQLAIPDSVIYDLRKNVSPIVRQMSDVRSPMRAALWDPEHDMAHERDFESEDLDFQPEDFKMQVRLF